MNPSTRLAAPLLLLAATATAGPVPQEGAPLDLGALLSGHSKLTRGVVERAEEHRERH